MSDLCGRSYFHGLGKAYDEDGKVVEYPLGKNGQVSPLVDEASEVAARHHVLKTNLIANGYLDFTPVEGLTLPRGALVAARHSTFSARSSCA